MVRKQTGALMECLSRREVLRCLAGFMITASLEGCAQSLSSSSTAVPVPTPRPRGSVFYTYHGHSDILNTVAWSPDGKYIASGSADGTVRMWEVATGKQKYVYRGHLASVNSLVWSPDSQRIASGSSDKTVQVWDATTGNHRYTYLGHPTMLTPIS